MGAESRDYEVVFKEKNADNIQRKTSKIEKGFGALTSKLKAAGAAAVGIGAAFATVDAVQVAGDFEALEVRLQGLFNSVEDGSRAFNRFKQVATTTPFAVRDVVEAGAQLKAFGVNAESNIKIAADLAAFMGTTIPEAASAMGRAFSGGAGAADIFRERGILTLIATKQNIDITKASIDEFREAMFKTFQDPTSGIAGATDRLSKTFTGAVSNAGDSITNLAAAIGEKLLPAVKEDLGAFTQFTNNMALIIEAKMPESDGSFLQGFFNWAAKFPQSHLGAIVNGIKQLNKEVEETASDIQFKKDVVAGLAEYKRKVEEAKEAEKKAARERAYQRHLDGIADRLMTRVNPVIKTAEMNAHNFAAELRFIGVNAQIVDPVLAQLNKTLQQTVDRADAIEDVAPDPNPWDLFRDRVEAVSSVIQDSFIAQWRDGENLFESFGDAFVAMLERMASELLARAAIFSILNFIPGLNNIAFGSGNFLNAVLGPVLDQGTGSLNFGQSNLRAPSGSGGGTVVIQAIDDKNVADWARRGGIEVLAQELGYRI